MLFARRQCEPAFRIALRGMQPDIDCFFGPMRSPRPASCLSIPTANPMPLPVRFRTFPRANIR
jgi:hypothetical protein